MSPHPQGTVVHEMVQWVWKWCIWHAMFFTVTRNQPSWTHIRKFEGSKHHLRESILDKCHLICNKAHSKCPGALTFVMVWSDFPEKKEWANWFMGILLLNEWGETGILIALPCKSVENKRPWIFDQVQGYVLSLLYEKQSFRGKWAVGINTYSQLSQS